MLGSDTERCISRGTWSKCRRHGDIRLRWQNSTNFFLFITEDLTLKLRHPFPRGSLSSYKKNWCFGTNDYVCASSTGLYKSSSNKTLQNVGNCMRFKQRTSSWLLISPFNWNLPKNASRIWCMWVGCEAGISDLWDNPRPARPMTVIINPLKQWSSTRGLRAACGPRASFVCPGKGISQNTMRYEYWSLNNMTTGAQITHLRGNASVPHPLLWRNEASLLTQWRTM